MEVTDKKSLKDEIQAISETKGNVKGELLRSYFKYIKIKEGDEGVAKVEKMTEEIGFSFKGSDIMPFHWYPAFYEPMIVLAAKEAFNWTDEDVFELGFNIVKFSLLVRTMLQLFVSPEKLFNQARKYWNQNYDFGDLESAEMERGKSYTLRIKGYKIHPIACIYNAGYMLGMTQLTTKDKLEIREVKCTAKGDDYDEFIITYKE